MNLPKAIEVLERWYAGGYATQIDDMNPAVRLLTEAGKRIVYLRKDMDCPHWMTLPGETKE